LIFLVGSCKLTPSLASATCGQLDLRCEDKNVVKCGNIAVLNMALLAFTATAVLGESDGEFPNSIQPIFAKYCAGCHGKEEQKGDLRFDRLDPDIVHGKDAETWQLVLDQLNLGDMPPKKAKRRPKDSERRALVNWLTGSLKEAAELKQKDVRVVIRRLTREQYTNSLRDLLSLDVNFGQDLPPDGLSADGFKNNGAEQVISLLQTDYYMTIAERALKKAIITDTPPVSYRYSFKFGAGINTDRRNKDGRKTGSREVPVSDRDHTVETFENRNVGTAASAFVVNDFRKRCYPDLRGAQNKRFSIEQDGVLLKPAIPHVERGDFVWLAPMPSLKLHLRDFPMEGDFVLRVKVAQADPKNEATPYLRACIGEWLDHGEDFKTLERSVEVTGTLNKFQTIEFRGRLENFPVPIYDPEKKDIATMIVVGVWNDAMARDKSVKGPAVIVKSMEFECGHVGTWPPTSQKHILFPSKNSGTEAVYSREVIQNFMNRAFRRRATSEEVDAYHGLWKSLRPDCASFEQSIRETLASVLCSPHFLYLVESPAPPEVAAPNTITEHQLASRLAYFLWNSMPDDRLLELAEKKQLRDELPAEIDRMIKDPRSANFVTSFCEQWLQMEKMTHTKVDIGKFPRFNRFVRDDMLRETRLFFAEVLHEDMSIMNLVDADFTMLNQNLAQFYGIDNVKGGQFRKVTLADDAKRGGLISQGLFLTGNSNGREPHPIKRGAWLISRILDDPPPPPPPNVPRIDEDDPAVAKFSIKEQLQRHRENPSCVDCHRKVDPWGLLLENYNAVGLWKHRDGAAEATLPKGETLDGVDALKQYILKEKNEQFTRALVQHLLRYALGRSLSFTDRIAIDEIVKKVEKDDYKLQGLLQAMITSPLFSAK
jgi:mono/diheme cytochrome c family protein